MSIKNNEHMRVIWLGHDFASSARITRESQNKKISKILCRNLAPFILPIKPQKPATKIILEHSTKVNFSKMPANNKTFLDFCKSGGRITCSQVKKIIEEIEILEKKKLKNILTLIMGLLLASLAGMNVNHPRFWMVSVKTI